MTGKDSNGLGEKVLGSTAGGDARRRQTMAYGDSNSRQRVQGKHRSVGILTAVAVVAALALTLGPANAAYPGVSGKIAYQSFVIPAAGSPGSNEILVIEPDGSGQTNLTNTADASEVHATWSPNGQKIAYVRDANIWVMNADGSGQTNLTQTANLAASHPSWSPDGAQIVFSRGASLWVVNSDGTGLALLVDPPSVTAGQPVWSPLGGKITYTGGRDIWVVNADGSSPVNITNNGTTMEEGEPDWSPDGSRIVFWRSTSNGDQVWTMDPDGSNQLNVSPTGVLSPRRPAWSPDGTKIVLNTGTNNIRTMNADGSEVSGQLANPAHFPDWQPLEETTTTSASPTTSTSSTSTSSTSTTSTSTTSTSTSSTSTSSTSTSSTSTTSTSTTTTTPPTTCSYPAPPGAEGPDSVTLTKETSSATTRLVYEDGGTVEAVDRMGNRYTLTIPPGALLEPTRITLTPIREARGLPVCGGQFLGVDAAPDGLRFYQVARLEVTPADSSAGGKAIAFRSSGDGNELHLHPLAVDPNRLVFEIVHFSEAMVQVSQGDVGPVLVIPPKRPVDYEKAIRQEMAERTRLERDAAIDGRPGDPDYAEAMRELFEKYYELFVEPVLPKIEFDCDFAQQNLAKVVGFARNAELFLADGASHMSQPILRTTKAAVENCFRRAVTPCLDRKNSEQLSRATYFAGLAQLLGGDPDEFNVWDERYTCTGDAVGRVTWTRTAETNYQGEGSSKGTTTETLEINALFDREGGGGLRNAGTGYTYRREHESTSSGWKHPCLNYTSESSAYSAGLVHFAQLSWTLRAPEIAFLDVGGFGARGTGTSDGCGRGSWTFSVRFPEFRDNGCSLRSPDGPFPGHLEGRATADSGAKTVDFTCSQTRVRTLANGVELRETVRVTGVILVKAG